MLRKTNGWLVGLSIVTMVILRVATAFPTADETTGNKTQSKLAFTDKMLFLT